MKKNNVTAKRRRRLEGRAHGETAGRAMASLVRRSAHVPRDQIAFLFENKIIPITPIDHTGIKGKSWVKTKPFSIR